METRHSNDRLSLYGIGDTPAFVAKRRHAILTRCLPFVTKVAASEILNKLRRAKKQSVSFYALPSQVRLGDVDAFNFFQIKDDHL
jgi:hypothetical protein